MTWRYLRVKHSNIILYYYNIILDIVDGKLDTINVSNE